MKQTVSLLCGLNKESEIDYGLVASQCCPV